jgi:hypothetical protein
VTSGVRPACYSDRRMEAAVWTAIAVLAATNLGSLFYLGARIDAQSARIDAQATDLGARIEAQGARLDARIEALTERIDTQNARIDTLSVTMADHVRRHAG